MAWNVQCRMRSPFRKDNCLIFIHSFIYSSCCMPSAVLGAENTPENVTSYSSGEELYSQAVMLGRKKIKEDYGVVNEKERVDRDLSWAGIWGGEGAMWLLAGRACPGATASANAWDSSVPSTLTPWYGGGLRLLSGEGGRGREELDGSYGNDQSWTGRKVRTRTRWRHKTTLVNGFWARDGWSGGIRVISEWTLWVEIREGIQIGVTMRQNTRSMEVRQSSNRETSMLGGSSVQLLKSTTTNTVVRQRFGC